MSKTGWFSDTTIRERPSLVPKTAIPRNTENLHRHCGVEQDQVVEDEVDEVLQVEEQARNERQFGRCIGFYTVATIGLEEFGRQLLDRGNRASSTLAIPARNTHDTEHKVRWCCQRWMANQYDCSCSCFDLLQ
jgi:hypothetical protein